jgi:hypothetical protein
MKKYESTIDLRQETYDNLLYYAEILELSPEMIVERALDAFFAEVNRQLGEKNPLDDNLQTNLGYDEFWDGVDI